MDTIYMVLMVLFVISISYGIIRITKYLKDVMRVESEDVLNAIDVTKLAVSFISEIFKESGLESDKVNKIMPIIISSLEYIRTLSSNKSEKEVLADALVMVKTLSYECDIHITNSDIVIIESVLKLANDFYVYNEKTNK